MAAGMGIAMCVKTKQLHAPALSTAQIRKMKRTACTTISRLVFQARLLQEPVCVGGG